jgi:hypothetical protein
VAGTHPGPGGTVAVRGVKIVMSTPRSAMRASAVRVSIPVTVHNRAASA